MRIKKQSLTLIFLTILLSQLFLFSFNIPLVYAGVLGNWIDNPGFEIGALDGWNHSGLWTNATNGPHSGSKYARSDTSQMAGQLYPTVKHNLPMPVDLIDYFYCYAKYVAYGDSSQITMQCTFIYNDTTHTHSQKVLTVNGAWVFWDLKADMVLTKNLTSWYFDIASFVGSQACWGGIDDVYMGSPMITLDGEQMGSESDPYWVFTDWKYYTFTASIKTVLFDETIDFFWLNFSLPTSDGLANFTVWSDKTTWNYSLDLNNTDRSLDPLRIKAGSSSLNDTFFTITFPIWFTSKCLDTLDPEDAIDVYARFNDTTGTDTGWELGASELFRVYNLGGGSTQTQVTGDAGQILGGKQFSYFSYAGGHVYSDLIWRNLQHIKLLPEITCYAGYEAFTISGGFDYSLADGSYLRGWQYDIKVSHVAYTGWLAANNWINMSVTWSFNNSYVKADNIYMFYHQPVENPGDQLRYRLWIDLWFDNTNASTFGGGRINAYEYPVEDNAAAWLRWLSSSWGVKDSVEKESMCLFPLNDTSGTALSTERIKMVKVWMALDVDPGEGGQYVIMDKFDVWDTTLGKIPLQGIPTPVFDETKMPAMSNTGFLGFIFSAFTGLIKWISDNIVFGGLTLWPAFVAFLDMIAGWLGFPNFFSNLFNWLGSIWIWLVDSFSYGITVIYNLFLFMGSILGSFLAVMAEAIGHFITVIGMIQGFLGGAYGAGVNLWEAFNISTWLTLVLIFYPLYLIILWDEEGMDAVIGQLTILFGILSWLAHFFIAIINLVLNVIGRIIESIPVVE